VNSLQLAKAHLSKAQEYLTAAELTLGLDLYNAAASNAVTSGINSKDAICMKRNGRINKTESHTDAVRDLKRAGRDGSALASNLTRLISIKTKAQYQSTSVAPSASRRAVEQAKKMYEAAQIIVNE